MRGADGAQHLGDGDDVARRRHLGHQDGVGPDRGRCPQVVHTPGGLDGVDADDELAPPVAATFHGRANVGARRHLAFRRDRVFEVEDQRVGGKSLRLFQRALVRARHVEHAAARTDGHRVSPLVRRTLARVAAKTKASAHSLAALCPLGGSAGLRHSRTDGPHPRPLLPRRLRLRRARRDRPGPAVARPRGRRPADGGAVEPPRLSAPCRRGDPGGAARPHARLAGGQRLARRHRRRAHRLPADAGACREARVSRRAHPPRQPGRALHLRSGVRRRRRKASTWRRKRPPPSASISCRSPTSRRPTGWSCRGSPASPSTTPAARQAACALDVPTVLATSTPAGEDRLANASRRRALARACYVDRHPAAPHGTGDLLAALYLGNSLNGADPGRRLARPSSAVAASIAASSGRRRAAARRRPLGEGPALAGSSPIDVVGARARERRRDGQQEAEQRAVQRRSPS